MHDKRVTDLIKKYLKSGVMENGVHCKTKEGSPQGGSLSPLLANIYLNEFDQKMEKVKVYVRVWIGYFYVTDKTDPAKLEWMVAKETPHVHLERVEEAENKGREPAKAWDTGVAGLPVGKLPFGLLAHS